MASTTSGSKLTVGAIAQSDSAPQVFNDLLSQYGQEHILRFWGELTQAERAAFTEQIMSIDLDRLDRLANGEVACCDADGLSDRIAAPPARRIDTGGPIQSAKLIGEEALRCGLFGVTIVAGGQGSRLGFPHPKGMYPIGPVAETSLFQILIEKIRAVAARYEVRIPLYLMTSPATHEETVAFLTENDMFGLPAEDVFVFCQGTMPAVDEETGKLLLATKGSLFMSPDGHGGMLAALLESGAIDDIRSRGIEHLFYCQIDNPLIELLSPEFLGYHILANSDVTTQVVAKDDPTEKVGNVVSVDGRLQIIEYSDLPVELAERRAEDGSLELWAGNIAVHAFSVAFLEESLGADNRLPFHVARKKIPHIDEGGDLVTPEVSNGVKFEQFIFDLLPMARRSLVVEVNESHAFAPLKNAEGKDSPDDVRRRMMNEFRRWLHDAGTIVADDMCVEISPLRACSPDQLDARLIPIPSESDRGWYLGPA